jgi:hypothetical protein
VGELVAERECQEQEAEEMRAEWDKHLEELEAAVAERNHECNEWREHALQAEGTVEERSREVVTVAEQGGEATVGGKFVTY